MSEPEFTIEDERPQTEALPARPPAFLTSPETAGSAAAARETALVQARYVIAIKQPRDLDVVREKLLKECARPSFAKVARYKKPIGAGVYGPSIRFAEAAIRCMKNIVVDTLVVYDDDEKRIIQVSVTDLEANVPYTQSVTITKTVERKKRDAERRVLGERFNAAGEKVFIVEATEDELLNKQNALVSKAIRSSGLRLIPGDITDECMAAVIHTQKDADAKDPDAARLQLFDFFGELGVTVAQLKEYLGHDRPDLNPAELADLRGLYSAIRDGETSWQAVMENRRPAGEQQGASAPASSRPPPPPRRGGARAAAAKAAAIPTNEPKQEPPKPAEPATTEKTGIVTPPAADKPATTESASKITLPAALGNPATCPEIAKGVTLVGYHGKAWPQLIGFELVEVVAKKFNTESAFVEMIVKTPGYDGKVFALPEEHCAEMKDGAPFVTSKILKPGALLEANWAARPCAKAGQTDYTRPPRIFLTAITTANEDPFA